MEDCGKKSFNYFQLKRYKRIDKETKPLLLRCATGSTKWQKKEQRIKKSVKNFPLNTNEKDDDALEMSRKHFSHIERPVINYADVSRMVLKNWKMIG